MKGLVRLLLVSSLFFLGCATTASAQFTRHIVWLKNKGGNTFTIGNPSAYLSARAIQRRANQQINLDSTDLPVTTAYLDAIRAISGVTVVNVSKWLNAVCIQTSNAATLAAVQQLPFVQRTGGLADRSMTGRGIDKFIESELLTPLEEIAAKNEGLAGDFYNYGSSAGNEIKLHKGEFLHNIGLRGQGMHIAMLDGGFFNYNSLRAFDSVNRNGQILSTWDFVSRNATVSDDHPHGMQCLSTIAANIPGQFVGKAPQASFHLFRTEDVNSEYPIEEFNWVCAAERADSIGADLISSSLGYYDFDNPVFNYTYSQLNGNTTLSVRGADWAAKKGLLVFNSAGNEGNSAWRYIITPADGDSVLAIGAVNALGTVGSFSSYGPATGGRIKPDIASVGVAAVVQSSNNNIATANGTSFSCPNMAGLGACLWQGFPEFNNMKIAEALKRSGSRYTTPDDRMGYGIPDLQQAFSWLLSEYATVSAQLNSCVATINWKSKDVESMRYELQRMLPGETNYTTIYQTSPAAGQVLRNNNYQYSDRLETIQSGTIKYRVVQWIDTAAATKRSVLIDSTQLLLSNPCIASSAPQIQLFPNPATHTTRLVINYAGTNPLLQVAISDMAGRIIARYTVPLRSPSSSTDVLLSAFPKGAYLVTVWDQAEKVGTIKLIKD
ncbi:MAG: T9SS C-terminal target domain-containing protein [Chitinophagia bacterium]|nr:T9SS C-terminal target domain-containing protein [Chitinophagia bacterium]